MALSGSITTTANRNRSVTLSWTATQDIANNKSTISWSLTGSGSASGYVIVGEIRVTINGSAVFYRDTSVRTECYNGTVLKTGTTVIYHGTDGTKEFAITVEAGIYNWSINCTGTQNFTLDTIPRASTLTFSTFTIGSAGTITINRANSNFKHTIRYAFGNISNTVIYTKTSSTSVSWTPAMELCNQIPNNASGTGTLICETYNGDTLIGTKEFAFTANVPSSVVPTISSFTATRVDNTVPSAWGIYVQGKSQCTLAVTASGSYGSTISSYSIKQGSAIIGTSAQITTGLLLNSGAIVFTAVVTDSRGRTNTTSVSIAVSAYTVPTISSYLSQRCLQNGNLSDDGTYVKGTCSFNYSNCSSKNTITSKVYYRRNGTDNWDAGTNFTSGTALTFGGGNISTEYAYEIKFEVTDAFQTISVFDVVSTAFSTMDFKAGGKGVAFGKVSEKDNYIESDFTGQFRKGLVVGTSLIPTYEEKTLNNMVYPLCLNNSSNRCSPDITNGSFIYADGTSKFGDTSLGIGVDLDYSEATVEFSQNQQWIRPVINKTHIYYMCFWMAQIADVGLIDVYWQNAEPPAISSAQVTSANTWTKISARFNRNSSNFSNGAQDLIFVYDSSHTTNKAYIDGIALYDLTEAFGAGNEPDKAWCDANLDYEYQSITVLNPSFQFQPQLLCDYPIHANGGLYIGGNAVGDNPISDFVVSQGTDGIWTYRKWSSGIAECWGTWVGQLAYYYTVNNWYAYNQSMSFPTNFFIEPPTVVYSGGVASTFSTSGMVNILTKDAVTCYAMASYGASGSAQEVRFHISAKGKWK